MLRKFSSSIGHFNLERGEREREEIEERNERKKGLREGEGEKEDRRKNVHINNYSSLPDIRVFY